MNKPRPTVVSSLLSLAVAVLVVLTPGRSAQAACAAMKIVEKANQPKVSLRAKAVELPIGTVTHLMQTAEGKYRVDLEGGSSLDVDGPLEVMAGGVRRGEAMTGKLTLNDISRRLSEHRIKHNRVDVTHPAIADHGSMSTAERQRAADAHAAAHRDGTAHHHDH